MSKEIALGDEVKDEITGFTGIVVGMTSWLNGCDTVGIRSRELKDGIPTEVQWFDDNQIKVVKKGAVKLDTSDPGGPQPNPTRQVAPGR
jgi:hypothetical protein